MKFACLSWNVRGLGRPEKVKAVSRVCRESRAEFIFLQETKIQDINPVLSRTLMGRINFELVHMPSVGSAGGLILLWDKDSLSMEKVIVDARAIILVGRLLAVNRNVGLINVYAPNSLMERRSFFSSLIDRIHDIFVPVIVGGDFNSVLSEDERRGTEYCARDSRLFSEFISSNGLLDLPMEDLIQASLSRSLSDHKAILLKNREASIVRRPFKWFSHWSENKEYVTLVEKTISKEGAVSMGDVLRNVKNATKSWVAKFKEEEAHSVKRIEKRMDELENDLIKGDGDEYKIAELRSLRGSLWATHKRIAREWAQKSRVRWLLDGDKNTKFFHISDTLRRNRNHIGSTRVGDEVMKDSARIRKAFEAHFKECYNISNTLPVKHFGCKLNRLKSKSAVMLEAKFSTEEVWSAIKSAEDCEQVLHWIADTRHCPAVFLDRILECVQFGERHKWKFQFAYRESNGTAHRLAKRWPKTLILLITPPPVDEDERIRQPYVENPSGLPDRTNEAAGCFAQACVETAGECGVPVVDLWTRMQQSPDWRKAYLRYYHFVDCVTTASSDRPDGLHLTQEGNKVVFEEVLKKLNEGGLSLEKLKADLPLFADIDRGDPLKAFQQ
ncbi:hypothetical protein HRI_004092900 [Hibiscus trionum]|uniref:Endonuclease/exonuclease/phosphatase domain-containing protein n=1 Tax=Hibiscus trionum TaxID=183268 RepID=A0A9W7IXN3_HIBTR|nr:hypothetical protein HRI_004092900 [Hibiscus trionum]